MDHELVKRGLSFASRRKKWIALLAAFGVSGFAAYRVYHLPSVARKRKRFVRLLGVVVSVLELASDSAETISLVSKDLKEFLDSDEDEIPRSLKQISKIARSEEFSQSVSRVTEALTVGVIRGYNKEAGVKNGYNVSTRSNYADKVMDRLLSSAGTGFASVIVGSFARNLVVGYYSSRESEDGSKANGEKCVSNSSEMPYWLSIACDDKGKELLGDCIQKFVSTAVAVYLDKTMSINVYDDIFTGLTNPKHQDKVQDLLVAVINGAINTLVKTSHQVMTNPDIGEKACSVVYDTKEHNIVGDQYSTLEVPNSIALVEDGGWASKFSSTLSVPSNKRFVLDVTGRVTFETIRSLLLFMSWKLSEGIRKRVDTVHEEVTHRGYEVVQYISNKSSIIVTLCVALYLHVLGGTGVLLIA